MQEKNIMAIIDKENKLIELDFQDIRKIYLIPFETYGQIWYYNGDKIDISLDNYYRIQDYLIENHLFKYMNRFDIPQELQDKYECDNQKLDNYKILHTMVNEFKEKQVIVAIEELSELQKELCKSLRNKDKINLDNLIEEIADVEIMLEQMKIYFNLSNLKIILKKQEKIDRTKERYL